MSFGQRLVPCCRDHGNGGGGDEELSRLWCSIVLCQVLRIYSFGVCILSVAWLLSLLARIRNFAVGLERPLCKRQWPSAELSRAVPERVWGSGVSVANSCRIAYRGCYVSGEGC